VTDSARTIGIVVLGVIAVAAVLTSGFLLYHQADAEAVTALAGVAIGALTALAVKSGKDG
jgi:flagellar basal body-associated protein FliL